MNKFKNSMLQRFLKYVTFDTESCDDATTVPTTEGQFVFARFLEQELKAMGLPVEPVYTIDQAVGEIKRLKGGAVHA